jgi:hypothetical protein
VSVLTAIPRARGAPGLQIYDFAANDGRGSWVRMEGGDDVGEDVDDGGSGAVVLMAGEMLQRLTNNIIVATQHRVVLDAPAAAATNGNGDAVAANASPRMSMPFELFLNPSSTIDYNVLWPSASPEQRARWNPDCAVVERPHEFIARSSKGLISVNSM